MSGNDQNLSDADKIRLKRLARLGGPASQASQSSQNEQSGNDQQGLQPAAESRAPPSAASRLLSLERTPSVPPASGSSSSPAPVSRASPTPSLAPATPANPIKRKTVPTQTASPPVGRATPTAPSLQPPPLEYADWEASKVSTIFAVTLDKAVAAASSWKLCWLKDLEQEIREEHPDDPSQLKINMNLRDRLLVARLQLDMASMATSGDQDQLNNLSGMPKDQTVFEYLTGCWKRLYMANREFARFAYGKEEKATWAESFGELKRLIISYCGLTLEDPSMFPQPPERPVGPAEFLPLLLNVTQTNSGGGDPYTSSTPSAPSKTAEALAPTDLLPFLNDLAVGFTGGSMGDVITPTLSLFFQEWFKINPTPDLTGNEWRQYLGAVALLVQVKSIASILPSLPIWVAPGVTAPKLEWQSLLGPLTRLSVFPREFPQIEKTYFSNPTERQVADIDANKANLRSALTNLQSSLFGIYNAIVRGSAESREGVLDFFAQVVNLNQKRAGMRVNYATVSSDGFMINIQAVLLKLFEPVMDVQFSKLDKVDPGYYRYSKRLNVEEETKIHASKEEADEYSSSVMETDSTPNFISDIFFMLNSVHHLGLLKTIGTRKDLEKGISELEDDLRNFEARREEWAANPTTQAQGEAKVKKLKDNIARSHAAIHSFDTQLLDPKFTRQNVTFCGFVMNWLLRMVDPKHQHPQVPISLPLPSEAPVQFRMLPEFLFENIVEYYEFLSRYDPDALDNGDKDILITFAITFLSPTYVKNPFLKAKIVATLANGLYPVGYYRRGTLFDRLSVHTLSTTHLMPTLIRFFIDVENTGGHGQFFDKFNFRRDISRIIKSMWANPLHREAFVQSTKDDSDQFIKFVNMLMSDTTWYLEESLTNLAKIHSIRAQKADVQQWNELSDQERTDAEALLKQAERGAPFPTAMGRDHAELIRDITATTKEPFLTGEIVDRLAASLDENLTNLIGPKMQDLKLSDPERFSFKPKPLLAAIAQIYLNLGNEPAFIRAVANDGRSYSKGLFERFARVLRNRAVMTEGEAEAILGFVTRVENAKATMEEEDEREIPDEFLDPLLATLMKDPVILPISRVVIDRSTIRAVLLSKDQDPFNNMPLKYEDIIPDTELKLKIDAWIAEGKNGGDDAMDTKP